MTINKRHITLTSILILSITCMLTLGQRTLASDEKHLSFYHTHTGKRLDVVYARNGAYVPSSLAAINDFLSDFRNGERADIDPELLDIIYDVRESLGSDGTYQIISAYRSPQTNAMLRSSSSGVAKNSQHILGKAIDVRLEGVETTALRDQARALKRGGVGYYESSDFVHIDTGRVRIW